MFLIHFLKEQAMRKLNLIIKFFKKIVFLLLILFCETSFSHEGHSHGPSVVTSASFDQLGTLLPFGGVLADRFDRKNMMIIGDLGATLTGTKII